MVKGYWSRCAKHPVRGEGVGSNNHEFSMNIFDYSWHIHGHLCTRDQFLASRTANSLPEDVFPFAEDHQRASENEEEDESEPEGVVAPDAGEGVVKDEEDGGGDEHHVAHGGGSGGPDVDAVIDERRETGEWQQSYYACPDEGRSFKGWYDETGKLVSADAVWNDEYGTSRILTAEFEKQTEYYVNQSGD